MEALLQEALKVHLNAVNSLNEEIRVLKAENAELRRCYANYKQNSDELLKKACQLITSKDMLVQVPRSIAVAESPPKKPVAEASSVYETFLTELQRLDDKPSEIQDSEDSFTTSESDTIMNEAIVDESIVEDSQVCTSSKFTGASVAKQNAASTASVSEVAAAAQLPKRGDPVVANERDKEKDKEKVQKKATSASGWLNAKSKQSKLNVAAFKQPSTSTFFQSATSVSSSTKMARDSSSERSQSSARADETRKLSAADPAHSRTADGEPSQKRVARSPVAGDSDSKLRSDLMSHRASSSESKLSFQTTDSDVKQKDGKAEGKLECVDSGNQMERNVAVFDSKSATTVQTTACVASASSQSALGSQTQMDVNDTQLTTATGAFVSTAALAISTQKAAVIGSKQDAVSDSVTLASASCFRPPVSTARRSVDQVADDKDVVVLDANRNRSSRGRLSDSGLQSSIMSASAKQADAKGALRTTEKNEPTYKYYETSRKRNDRDRHAAFTCRECEQYFKSMGLSEAERRGRLAACSRHRARFELPSTPEGFWSLEIPSTPPEERFEFEERKRKFEAARAAKRQVESVQGAAAQVNTPIGSRVHLSNDNHRSASPM